MTSKPITLSAHEVRAALEGRLGMVLVKLTTGNTRFNGGPWSRLHKEQEWDWDGAWVDNGPSPAGNDGPYLKLPWKGGDTATFSETIHRIYPPHAIGDRLWVREAHSLHRAFGRSVDGERWGPWGGLPSRISPDKEQIAYFREGFDRSGPPKWRPSTHMPRWASRLTLTVTDVKVMRVRDMSEADAEACGSTPHLWHAEGNPMQALRGGFVDSLSHDWTAKHGPDAWDQDWVTACAVTVEKRNEEVK